MSVLTWMDATVIIVICAVAAACVLRDMSQSRK